MRGRDEGTEETAKAPRDLRANHPLPLFRYVSSARGAVLAGPPGPPVAADGDGLYDAALRTAFGMSREAWAQAPRS